MHQNDKRKKNGFTLIELIAVLVILGILAGYAIPKYGDMQTNAALAALDGVGAAALSQCSIEYGSIAMTGTAPTTSAIATAAGNNLTADSKYTVGFDGTDAADITITVTDDNSNSKTYTWTLP